MKLDLLPRNVRRCGWVATSQPSEGKQCSIGQVVTHQARTRKDPTPIITHFCFGSLQMSWTIGYWGGLFWCYTRHQVMSLLGDYPAGWHDRLLSPAITKSSTALPWGHHDPCHRSMRLLHYFSGFPHIQLPTFLSTLNVGWYLSTVYIYTSPFESCFKRHQKYINQVLSCIFLWPAEKY